MAVDETSCKAPAKKRALIHASSPARKKRRSHASLTANELPWTNVARADSGMMELEEVEGVDVVYEMTDAGSVARFNVVAPAEQTNAENEHVAMATESRDVVQDAVDVKVQPFDCEQLLPDWHCFSLHPQLLRALHLKGFSSPTPIQAAALPLALASRDVIGVAQTGSGKTLAYGLPILQHLLTLPRPTPGTRRPLRALVLAPTRELAFQVSAHLNEIITPVDTQAAAKGKESENASRPRPVPHVSVASIVGGMSAQKQRRILARGVDVLVATPGRLWDIMEEDDTLSRELKNIRFLVLDEADRMIEAGHFAELDHILKLTLRERECVGPTGDDKEGANMAGMSNGLQTFVFSATLSKDLQRNFKKHRRPQTNYKKGGKKQEAPATTLDDLIMLLDFRDPEPAIINLSPVGNVVSTLREGKVECLAKDKDVYLYYFLLRYPGRSLVFLASIDGIRRLMPLVTLLGINAFPLHSQLEQRQRLKNLDRFRTTPNSVLLATDIAARGLDIPSVDHVVHFQIPRSADTYIHRNGRTARAMRRGFSMVMCAPDERRIVGALLGSLGREISEIPDMAVDLSMLDQLKRRVQLAREIDQVQHKIRKTNHERKWMKETAAALDVELDSDFDSDNGDKGKVSTHKRKAQEAKSAVLQAELSRLLAQPLVARGVSTRYITSGSRPIVDDLLAGALNEHMVGLKKVEAGDDLVLKEKKMEKASTAKRRKGGEKGKQRVKPGYPSVQTEEDEEWAGISL